MSATLSATRNAELQAALAAMGGAAGERPLLPHATSAGASSSVGGSSDRSTPADASGTPRHVNGSPGLAGAGGTTTASSGGGSSVAEMMGGNGGSSGGGAARKSAAAAATATASVSASAANSSGGGGGGVLLHQQELLAHMIRLSRDDMTEPSTDVDGNPQAPALPTVDEDTAASLHTQGGEDDADASAGAATLKASSPAAATALDGGIKPSSRRATATSSQLPAASGASAAAVAAGKQQGHSPSASTSSRSSPHQQQGLPQPRSSHSQSQQQQQLGEELPFDDPYPMRFTPQPVPMPSYSVGADGRVEYAWDPEFVDKKYEVLSLRVYHRKHRTGFEEHKDLPVHVDDLIAGRYHVVEFLGSAAFSKAVQAVDIKTGKQRKKKKKKKNSSANKEINHTKLSNHTHVEPYTRPGVHLCHIARTPHPSHLSYPPAPTRPPNPTPIPNNDVDTNVNNTYQARWCA